MSLFRSHLVDILCSIAIPLVPSSSSVPDCPDKQLKVISLVISFLRNLSISPRCVQLLIHTHPFFDFILRVLTQLSTPPPSPDRHNPSYSQLKTKNERVITFTLELLLALTDLLFVGRNFAIIDLDNTHTAGQVLFLAEGQEHDDDGDDGDVEETTSFTHVEPHTRTDPSTQTSEATQHTDISISPSAPEERGAFTVDLPQYVPLTHTRMDTVQQEESTFNTPMDRSRMIIEEHLSKLPDSCEPVTTDEKDMPQQNTVGIALLSYGVLSHIKKYQRYDEQHRNLMVRHIRKAAQKIRKFLEDILQDLRLMYAPSRVMST